MQYSLLHGVRNHPDRPYALADVYAEYISDALLAEELGFVRSWYGEHHFRADQWSGSPMVIAAAVAAQTTTLRVGTSIALLPFHDPIRVAEDAATTDILSRGRFDLGIGPGSQYEEFRSFRIDPAEMSSRTWESIDWIQRAFREEGEFSHSGSYYDIPNMTFTTKPVQDPLPVWYGGSGPRNTARAAERGFNLIGPGNFGYDEKLREAGRDPSQYQVSRMTPLCVADSTGAAWDAAGEGLHHFINFYQLRANLKGEPADPSAEITVDMMKRGEAGFWQPAVGTPEEVIAALTPVVQGALGRVTELSLQFRQPGMRSKETHRSMTLFAEEVLPALEELSAAA